MQETRVELSRSVAGSNARDSVAYLLDKLIFFTLLALIVLTAVPYGAAEPWWEAVFECTVFALGAMWIIEGLLTRKWHVGGYSLLAPLIGIVIWAFIQTLPLQGRSGVARGIESWSWRALSADPYETWLFVLKMLALVLYGAMLLRYTSSQIRLRSVIHTVIGIGVASALFGVVRQIGQRHGTGFILPRLEQEMGYGQFINRNHFAFLMEMVLGLILGLIIGRGVRRNQILIYLAMALPVWTALVLANSRGGIFSMIGQMIFIALLWNAIHRKMDDRGLDHGESSLLWRVAGTFVVRILLVACLVLTIGIAILWVGGDAVVRRLETVSEEVSFPNNDAQANERRIEIWRATWQLIKKHPVAGIGFGGYWAAISESYDGSGETTPQQAHNDYIEVLASGGIIGGALLVWFVVAFIKSSLGRIRSADSFRRAACLGALVGLFGIAIHSFFDFGLHIIANAVVFTSLIVIATVNGRVEGKRSSFERR